MPRWLVGTATAVAPRLLSSRSKSGTGHGGRARCITRGSWDAQNFYEPDLARARHRLFGEASVRQEADFLCGRRRPRSVQLAYSTTCHFAQLASLEYWLFVQFVTRSRVGQFVEASSLPEGGGRSAGCHPGVGRPSFPLLAGQPHRPAALRLPSYRPFDLGAGHALSMTAVRCAHG